MGTTLLETSMETQRSAYKDCDCNPFNRGPLGFPCWGTIGLKVWGYVVTATKGV